LLLLTRRDGVLFTPAASVSIGSFRKRLPVAAKIALVTAGPMAEVPGSPIPPGGSKPGRDG